ncbi:MAG: MFS transporter [Chloroflexota bacterium]
MVKKRNLYASIGYLLALILSLFLLGFISFREVQITYPTFAVENLVAQGDVVTNSLRPFLNEGLPLEQFPGFDNLTDPLLASDEFLVGMVVSDPTTGEIILSNASDDLLTPKINADALETSIIDQESAGFVVRENLFFYEVSIPLESKFGSVGELKLIADRQLILEGVYEFFLPVFVSIALIILMSLPALWIMEWRKPEISWNRLLFGGFYFVATIILVGTLINVYTDGINRKANTLTLSLANRIMDPLQFGLAISDFSGVDTLIDSYLELDSDIGYIALSSSESAESTNNTVLYHTDQSVIGQQFESQENYVEHHYLINQPDEAILTQLDVFLGIPLSIVYARLWAGVRNFLILFVACAFLASLIFSLNTSLIDHFLKDSKKGNVQSYLLGLISPLYFLIVFAEGLHASFLPQYIQSLAIADGFSPDQTSIIFTIYFLGFVAALLPSGWIAEKFGIRPLLIGGSIFYMGSMIALAMVDGFVMMYPIRLLAGISQGILYIAVQGFILAVAKKAKTSAAGIIVFGYNGGVISGTALGSLLAAYLSYQGAFLVGAGIAVLFTIYTWFMIPSIQKEKAEKTAADELSFFQKLARVGQDWRFIKTMLLIGIPTKAVLTGVTGYALQLVLSESGYGQDEIGQILMLYAGGVLISSQYASKAVDRSGKTDDVLFWGAIGGGLGLVLIGQLGAPFLSTIQFSSMGTIILIIGMLVLGLAHGFIHAPIVTHVAETEAAETLGKSSTTSIYRTLERLGHVSGPIVVSYLLLFSSRPGETFALIGAILIGFAILFRIEPARLIPVRSRSLSLEKGGSNS